MPPRAVGGVRREPLAVSRPNPTPKFSLLQPCHNQNARDKPNANRDSLRSAVCCAGLNRLGHLHGEVTGLKFLEQTCGIPPRQIGYSQHG
jgi:hypothetical protein